MATVDMKQVMDSLKNEPCLRLNWKEDSIANKEVFNQVRLQYPEMFSEIEDYNFDLPNGWLMPALKAFYQLNKLDVKIVQVKQKFAELRIYLKDRHYEGGGMTEAGKVVNTTEAESLKLCEFCGRNNKVSIWEQSYVCRVCVDCKRKLAEYNLISWILFDTREWDDRRLKDLLYCKQVAFEINRGDDITNHRSFYEHTMARLAEQG